MDILIITDINECTTDTHGCENGATCLNTDGSYTCTCVMGWTSDMCDTGWWLPSMSYILIKTSVYLLKLLFLSCLQV